MEQRLSVVSLGVDDLQRAKAFYEALGWTAASDETGIAAFNLLGIALTLYPWPDVAAEVGMTVEDPM